MLESLSPGLVWIGLAVIVALSALACEQIFRHLVNRFTRMQICYPHRVANQLPRVLHKGDIDEVVDVTNDRTIASR